MTMIVLGIVVTTDGEGDTYEVIHNGEVYDEVRRLDTALNILSVLLEKRIEVEIYGR